MDLQYEAITKQNKRKTNMDKYLCCAKEVSGEIYGFFLVCDGVGSTPLGGAVAGLAEEYLAQWFDEYCEKKDFSSPTKALTTAIFELNRNIVDRLKRQIHQGASTLTALLITPKLSVYCNLGDSRLYQYAGTPNTPWTLCTKDQCDKEGILMEYLGKPYGLNLSFGSAPTGAGKLLLCSDGFYRHLDWSEDSPLLAEANEETYLIALRHMVESLVQRGERDNITAVLVNIIP